MSTWPKMAFRFRRGRLVLWLALAAVCTGCLWGAVREVPLAGFELVVQRDSQSPEPLLISRDGSGCESLGQSFAAVCFQVPNLDPSVIGGGALGRLNDIDTPSLTALIWRARIDGDVTVCERGGLLGERLTRCHLAAVDPNYTEVHGDTTVQVPIGQ